MKKILPLFLIIGLSLSSIIGYSQAIREVDFTTRISQSQLVIEGKVINQRSFWDGNHHNIYTASKIEIYKVFKGTIGTSVLEIITPGGVVGTDKEEVHPSLELSKNETGIFILKNNSVSGLLGAVAVPQYEPYASVQGFVKYDLSSNKAYSPFASFNNINNTLYNSIENVTHVAYSAVQHFDVLQVTNNSSTNKAVPTITNFSPTTVTAGTETTITINGTNFGATAGTVGFADANDGGATFFTGLPSQIISWNDTQIIIEVPDRAGTGVIQVTNSDPASVTSAASLTVSFAELNVESDAVSTGTFVAYQPQHIDDNSTGGYTWQMFTDFDANTAAKESFTRAFDSWRCVSGTSINWSLGSVTTTDVVASDGINIIRDDNGAELPNGVLGRCTSRYSGCFAGGGTTLNWYVSEMDIVFDDGTNWNYATSAPAFTEFDFETVAVHELGHGHQLGHVISPGAIMHFSISNGSQNRTPGVNDIAGGNDVMSRSTATSVCSESIMTNFSVVAGAITGSQMEIENATGIIYSISPVLNATGYVWTVPTGATVASGQGTTNITVDFGTTSGDVTVTPTSGCGNGTPSDITVTLMSAGPVPVIQPQFCGITLSQVNQQVYSTLIPGATQYEFQLVPQGGGATLNYVSCCTFRLNLAWFTGWNYNTTYDVSVRAKVGGVFTSYGTSCPITSPDFVLPIIRPQFCGVTLSQVNQQIYSTLIPEATQYEFQLVPQGGGTTLNYVSCCTFRLNLAWFTGWNYNTTYDVSVRAEIDGVFTPYGASCPVTSPNFVLPTIRPQFCGTTVSQINQQVYSTFIPEATQYEFQLVPQGGGATLNYVSCCTFRLSFAWFSGWTANTTYDVSVRAMVDGAFTPYGASCPITSPSSTMAREVYDILSDESSVDNFDLVTNFDVNIYPNPNQGELIYLELEGLAPNSVSYVTDLSGRTILYKDLNNQNENVNMTLQFDEKLSAGFYFINVISGNKKVTKKLIVQ